MQLLKLTRRRLALGLGGVAVLLVGILVAIGWYYSDAIEAGALKVKHEPQKYDVKVLKVEDDLLTLRLPKGKDPQEEPGTTGIEWPGGYIRVGDIARIEGDEVIREFEEVEGSPSQGDMVRLDSFAFPTDPGRAHGASFEEVTFPSPLGELSAWFVDGVDDTWVIFVHGKGSNRREALRTLPVVQGAGLPALVISYRNDAGAPRDPSGRYQYGRTEWEDVQAAAKYAFANGANDVLLVGYSMGGGIVVSFLYRSPVADRVVGAVLDSPMLDFEAIVDWEAGKRHLPGFLTAVAKRLTSFRFDVNWGELDYLSGSGQISVPILLFHGDADETVPVSISETLAERRPDLVTYVPFNGAGHVRSWNIDPERYETVLGEFISRVAR